MPGRKGWEIVDGRLRARLPRVARPGLVGVFLIYHAAALTDYGDTVTQVPFEPPSAIRHIPSVPCTLTPVERWRPDSGLCIVSAQF